MHLIVICRQILRDLLACKLRSFLALSGIVWGTMTVVLLLALGSGFASVNRKSMMSIVDGTFFVVPGVPSSNYKGFTKGRKLNVKVSTVLNLQKAVPVLQKISPVLIKTSNVGIGSKMFRKEVYGVSPDFLHLRKIDIANPGRFFDQLDITNKRFVAVIGSKLKNQLFGNKDALYKTVIVNNARFVIIGVTRKSTSHIYDWYRNRIIVPYSAYINLFGNVNSYFFITFPDVNASSKTVEHSIRAFFAKHYHYDPKDKNALRIYDTRKVFQFMRWFFIGVQIFLGICGFFTLAVGSLGVANIMFLIVSERTREIGIKMALGAKYRDILLQILLEALIIVSIGGVVGLLLAHIITQVVKLFTLPSWFGTPVISHVTVLVTIIILLLTGVLAGLFPARRAAKMDPIVALGYG